MTAGAIGSFIGTPAEISLIRMTSDGRSAKSPLKWHLNDLSCKWNIKYGTRLDLMDCSNKVTVISCRLPLEQQRKYTSVFNALFRITKEEGLFTLWRVGAAQLKYNLSSWKCLIDIYAFRWPTAHLIMVSAMCKQFICNQSWTEASTLYLVRLLMALKLDCAKKDFAVCISVLQFQK